MSIVRTSIANPTGVLVGVALILLMGAYSLSKLPVQLFPSVERPYMSVMTFWRGASPREVEAEILRPQEEVLQGLPGLEQMTATARGGVSRIVLEMALETDLETALIEIINRINQAPPLPADAERPRVQFGQGWGGGGGPSLTYYFVQLLPETPGEITDHLALIEDVIKPAIASVPGVAQVQVNAGSAGWQGRILIEVDPFKAAGLGIELPQIVRLIGSANDVSGGYVEVGRKQYMLRFEGRFDPDEYGEQVLDWRDGSPIRLRDIATVAAVPAERNNFSIQNGNPAIGLRIEGEAGANVLTTLGDIKEVVAEIDEQTLAPLGLTMKQSFDATIFIQRAIALVSGNLLLGVILAIGLLWAFLRRTRATLLIAMAIPISLLATFIVLSLSGRTLNVISLAGLAFAVGMVLDAAIVVLENIVRYRERGVPPDRASREATEQVSGALLATTATTIAVFLPVLYLKDAEGQLFADLALTIAIAVFMSLLVALLVLPSAAAKYLRSGNERDRLAHVWDRMTGFIMRLTGKPLRRTAVIGTLIIGSLLITWLMVPKLDYLPSVKRDAVDAFLNFPPGITVDAAEKEIVQPIMERLKPFMDGTREPSLKNYYVIVWGSGGTIGVRVNDQDRVGELEQIMRREILTGIPDFRAFAAQGQLFGGFGGDGSVAIYLRSNDTVALFGTAEVGMQAVRRALPAATVRAEPTTDFAAPEIRLVADDRRLAEVGWNRSTAGMVVRMVGDGMWLGEQFDGEDRRDVILRANGWDEPSELAQVPVMTASGQLVSLGDLMTIEATTGPGELQRVDGRRTVTLNVSPPTGMSLEELLEVLETEVEPQIRDALPQDGTLVYGGSADQLRQAIITLGQNFLFALIILWLLVAALLRSPLDGLLVILALPLATAGGVLGLNLLNLFQYQTLDLLTMIGFIILLGLVVNNAILLVHQTRAAEREGLARRDAVAEGLRVRLRPIFMSTLTSVIGMLPLVLIPGAGSAIYRGLATVIVGGMSVSLLLTVILLPALLQIHWRPVKDKQEAAVAAPQTA